MMPPEWYARPMTVLIMPMRVLIMPMRVLGRVVWEGYSACVMPPVVCATDDFSAAAYSRGSVSTLTSSHDTWAGVASLHALCCMLQGCMLRRFTQLSSVSPAADNARGEARRGEVGREG